MAKVIVAGHINIETTVRVDGFPIPYAPVVYPFFGVRSTVAGVGYNITRALSTLGDQVRLQSLIGGDTAGEQVRSALDGHGLDGTDVLSELNETCQSAILYDETGRRKIYTDLKDIQEQTYPTPRFEQQLTDSDAAILCNINFTRPLLPSARRAGVPVITDVHAIGDLHDAYNADYMTAADVLFMSDESLPMAPEAWVRAIWEQYAAPVVVVGLGAAGALLGVRADNFLERVPAVAVRPVVNTVGAGDALLSGFVHAYLATGSPYEAIQRAVRFAGYKIGATGAAEGFLDHDGLWALGTD